VLEQLNVNSLLVAKLPQISQQLTLNMASTSSTATPQGHDIGALKKELYDYCLPMQQEGDYAVFHQSDLLEFDIIPKKDLTTLLQVVQALVNEKLFKIVTNADGVGWRLRTADEARKYVSA
jgi:hypothetical protein